MKSRRHRAIEKSGKDIPMLQNKYKNRWCKKIISEAIKRGQREFYKELNDYIKAGLNPYWIKKINKKYSLERKLNL